MTDFGYQLLSWSIPLDNFTVKDVRKRFPLVCQRKIKATLLGCVAGEYLKSTKLSDGRVIYWSDSLELMKLSVE